MNQLINTIGDDLVSYLEIARVAMKFRPVFIGEQLDLSDAEIKRLATKLESAMQNVEVA